MPSCINISATAPGVIEVNVSQEIMEILASLTKKYPKIYPKKYAYGPLFVVFCCQLVNFTQIIQGYFTATGGNHARCQWNNPEQKRVDKLHKSSLGFFY